MLVAKKFYRNYLRQAPRRLCKPVCERELIAAYVSGLNECRYCYSAHAAYAAEQLPEGMALVEHVRDGKIIRQCGIDERRTSQKYSSKRGHAGTARRLCQPISDCILAHRRQNPHYKRVESQRQSK